jgi:hypothetical protein
VVDAIAGLIRERPKFELAAAVPRLFTPLIPRRKAVYDPFNTLGKVRDHLRGPAMCRALASARERIQSIEIDRLRVKPIVKVTGEFWAQTTESHGNFRIFAFLESEGAELHVDPIGSWVMYLLFHARLRGRARRGIELPLGQTWSQPWTRLASELRYGSRQLLFGTGEWMWRREYDYIVDALGGTAHRLPPQDDLARLAEPFYNPLARGGEGHLEVGKTLYYSLRHHCHMVLSLKPFGCLPSTQSDGAQSAVVGRYPEILFLPLETAGDGEVHARSRVLMVLADAKARARKEFERALETGRRPLDDIRAYVADHPELRSPLYRVPRHAGVVGGAANFVLHVSQLMDRRSRRREPLMTWGAEQAS